MGFGWMASITEQQAGIDAVPRVGRYRWLIIAVLFVATTVN